MWTCVCVRVCVVNHVSAFNQPIRLCSVYSNILYSPEYTLKQFVETTYNCRVRNKKLTSNCLYFLQETQRWHVNDSFSPGSAIPWVCLYSRINARICARFYVQSLIARQRLNLTLTTETFTQCTRASAVCRETRAVLAV